GVPLEQAFIGLALAILAFFLMDKLKGLVPKEDVGLLASDGHGLVVQIIGDLGLLQHMLLAVFSGDGMEMHIDNEHILDMFQVLFNSDAPISDTTG
ncbi:hypothetical protein H4R33_004177, partial [Dimargaris cristalligena]